MDKRDPIYRRRQMEQGVAALLEIALETTAAVQEAPPAAYVDGELTEMLGNILATQAAVVMATAHACGLDRRAFLAEIARAFDEMNR